MKKDDLGKKAEKPLDYCFHGAETLKELLKKLLDHTEGAKTGLDDEHVHQMRVYSRRIRTSFWLYSRCFPKKGFNKWVKEIKKVTRSLGEARDLDVQIAFLSQYEARKTKKNDAAESLLKALKDKRNSMQEEVCSSIKSLEESGFAREVDGACAQILNAGSRDRDPRLAHLLAHMNISSHIDELLEYEACVEDEGDIKRHHLMRIAAKRLRYALEAYRGLYDQALEEKISVIKQFQDVLGEIHDCDIWISSMPAFMKDVRRKIRDDEGSLPGARFPENLLRKISSGKKRWRAERDAKAFLLDLRQRRRLLFKSFVSLWKDARKRRLFENLRDMTGTESIDTREKPLKMALISDIHGNIHALETVIRDAEKKGAACFIYAGDVVGHGAFPEKVVERMHNEGFSGIKGNFDRRIVEAASNKKKKLPEAVDYALRNLSKSSIRFLDNLPARLHMRVGGKNILVVHGSPDSDEEYMGKEAGTERLSEIAKKSGADVIVFGHTHNQYDETVEGVRFINPGSVGRPYDKDPRASYALLTLEPLSLELLKVEYDVEAAAEAAREAGLPEKLAQGLLRGEKDPVLEAEKDMSYEEKKAAIEETAKDHVDIGHSRQVALLASKLFFGLLPLHGMGEEEAFLLEAGCLLHDIGWSRGEKGHHKSSLRLILNDEKLPLDQRQRYIVGSIARYHRKRLPKKKDYNLEGLGRQDMETAVMLSAIARLADGMDYSHAGVVREMKVYYDERTIKLTLVHRGDNELERLTAEEKKDLATKAFKRNVSIEWRQEARRRKAA